MSFQNFASFLRPASSASYEKASQQPAPSSVSTSSAGQQHSSLPRWTLFFDRLETGLFVAQVEGGDCWAFYII